MRQEADAKAQGQPVTPVMPLQQAPLTGSDTQETPLPAAATA